MSFLAPLYLAAAAAIALPILFHLIRKAPKERVPFSSLMFLSATPPAITQRSRIEQWFLLLLRCLAICLLALAFARPFFRQQLPIPTLSGKAARMVILLDVSASMRRENLWEAARAKAQALIQQAKPEDEMALVLFDRTPRILVGFEEWSRTPAGDRAASAAGRLKEITPGYGGTHLGKALITATELLQEAGKRDPERGDGGGKILIISDLPEGTRLDGLQGFEWPKGTEVSVEVVKSPRRTNAGMQLLHADAESASAAPRIRVSNSSDAKNEQFEIGWAKPNENQISGETVKLYVPPNQSRTVVPPALPAGVTGQHLVLRGDEESFDNSLFLAARQKEEISVLYLGPDTASDSTQPLYYLKRGFEQEGARNIKIFPIGVLDNASPASKNAALIIFTEALSKQNTDALRALLQEGKTAVAILGNAAAGQTVADLLGVARLPIEEAAARNFSLLGQIEFNHPLFAPFADPRFSDFSKIHFWKHRKIDLTDVHGAQILARFDDGDPAVALVPAQKGTLLILTSGLQPVESQMALSSKFVPLLQSILELSGAIQSGPREYVVGDPVPIGQMVKGDPENITIRKPSGAAIQLTRATTFADTTEAGIYTITSIQPEVVFAVNIDPLESKTAPMPMEQLSRIGVPFKEARRPSTTTESKLKRTLAVEIENRQKVWRWAMVVALILLFAESAIAAWISRERTVPG